MSDDRLAQINAGATESGVYGANRRHFRAGAEWADAHPHSTPEALVAAYEDGQRDAAEKGVARSWITRKQLRMIVEAGRHWRDSDLVRLRSLAGIEVRDE